LLVYFSCQDCTLIIQPMIVTRSTLVIRANHALAEPSGCGTLLGACIDGGAFGMIEV